MIIPVNIDADRDRDLVNWLKKKRNRSHFIRHILYNCMLQSDNDNDNDNRDLYYDDISNTIYKNRDNVTSKFTYEKNNENINDKPRNNNEDNKTYSISTPSQIQENTVNENTNNLSESKDNADILGNIENCLNRLNFQ